MDSIMDKLTRNLLRRSASLWQQSPEFSISAQSVPSTVRRQLKPKEDSYWQSGYSGKRDFLEFDEGIAQAPDALEQNSVFFPASHRLTAERDKKSERDYASPMQPNTISSRDVEPEDLWAVQNKPEQERVSYGEAFGDASKQHPHSSTADFYDEKNGSHLSNKKNRQESTLNSEIAADLQDLKREMRALTGEAEKPLLKPTKENHTFNAGSDNAYRSYDQLNESTRLANDGKEPARRMTEKPAKQNKAKPRSQTLAPAPMRAAQAKTSSRDKRLKNSGLTIGAIYIDIVPQQERKASAAAIPAKKTSSRGARKSHLGTSSRYFGLGLT